MTHKTRHVTSRRHSRRKCRCQLTYHFLFLRTSRDTLDLKLNVKWNLSNTHSATLSLVDGPPTNINRVTSHPCALSNAFFYIWWPPYEWECVGRACHIINNIMMVLCVQMVGRLIWVVCIGHGRQRLFIMRGPNLGALRNRANMGTWGKVRKGRPRYILLATRPPMKWPQNSIRKGVGGEGGGTRGQSKSSRADPP